MFFFDFLFDQLLGIVQILIKIMNYHYLVRLLG